MHRIAIMGFSRAWKSGKNLSLVGAEPGEMVMGRQAVVKGKKQLIM